MEKATQVMILNSIINKKLLSPTALLNSDRTETPNKSLPYNVKTLVLLKNQDQRDFCARKQLRKQEMIAAKLI